MEYLVSIGSNEGRRQNMLLARRRLSELFADIRFSCEEETAPLYLHRPCRFSNQVAVLQPGGLLPFRPLRRRSACLPEGH